MSLQSIFDGFISTVSFLAVSSWSFHPGGLLWLARSWRFRSCGFVLVVSSWRFRLVGFILGALSWLLHPGDFILAVTPGWFRHAGSIPAFRLGGFIVAVSSWRFRLCGLARLMRRVCRSTTIPSIYTPSPSVCGMSQM